jgi:hypothetical protein
MQGINLVICATAVVLHGDSTDSWLLGQQVLLIAIQGTDTVAKSYHNSAHLLQCIHSWGWGCGLLFIKFGMICCTADELHLF